MKVQIIGKRLEIEWIISVTNSYGTIMKCGLSRLVHIVLHKPDEE